MGSEMCIRDRSKHVPCGHCWGSTVARLEWSGLDTYNRYTVSLCAVSQLPGWAGQDGRAVHATEEVDEYPF